MNSIDCPDCSETFSTEKAVRDHSWDTHGACHRCGETFDAREPLYTHWLDDHEGDLSTEARKRAEKKVGDRTVCPTCSDRFKSDGAVADHAWDAHSVCFLCGEDFDDETALHTHWLAVHEDDLSRSHRKRAERDVGELSFADRLTHQGPVSAVSGVSLGRREYLAGGGIALAGGLGMAVASGALGSDSKSEPSSGSGSFGGHPATASIASQPILGPALGDGEATIVAFEDPSCSACARFERGTFPELKIKLIEPGQLSFVYRGIPVVLPWGEPALLAMEATLQQSLSAFWALKEFYYRNQGTIGSNNVRAETRRFLQSQAGVDASMVMTAVEQGSTRGAVQTDSDAANQAGVGGTPTFYLFKGGSYQTKVVGPQPYSVFANALGL